MKNFNLAIELGSANTVIYKNNMGVVLKEPSVVAFELIGKRKHFKTVGLEAVKLYDKNPNDYELVYPINEGVITDINLCQQMLIEFLIKTNNKQMFKNNKVLLIVPCGLSEKEQASYKNVLYSLNVTKVVLIPNPILAYVSMNKGSEFNTKLVINFGGGVTDIAIISNANILFAGSISMGGIALNKIVSQKIVDEFGVALSNSVAEEVKQEIGTLLPNDISDVTVLGKDIITNNEISITISSKNMYGVFTQYFENIINGVETIISNCSNAIKMELKKSGVYVCGGMANFTGLERFIRNRLNMPIYIDDVPDLTVINGAGKLLNDNALLDKIISKIIIDKNER